MTLGSGWIDGPVFIVLLFVAVSCLLQANRLDRLHVRTDAALAALLAALERRAVVARSVALHLGSPEVTESLRTLAARTESVAFEEREAAENDLSQALQRLHGERLPAELAEELTDAERRVMLARRVHNDAVRDTLALRSRRLVRWLRLAGNAPQPGYFDIVDADPAGEDPAVGVRPGLAE
jgi:hypothetical protein